MIRIWFLRFVFRLLIMGTGVLLSCALGCGNARQLIVPAISWSTPASITYGTPLGSAQLNATVSAPGTLTYSPSSGTVLPAGVQTLSVTFTPQDPETYASATASVQLTVAQARPVLVWTTPSAIPYGTALSATQLDATANVSGEFVYTPAAGSIPGIGSDLLSAVFTPADSLDYQSATVTTTIQVTQATPKIQWTPADPIALGVPIGSYQLNAQAYRADGSPVPGTYVYNPPAGTVFNSVETEKLSVSFAPADSVSYTSAAQAILAPVTSFGVAAWGDSFTLGEQGETDRGQYPQDLRTRIVLKVRNLGVGHQTSTQIGVREGGVPTYATVTGGEIPASGGVTVTFPVGYEPVTAGGPPGGQPGTIAGVHGVVNLDSGVYTFTRTNPGDPVSVAESTRFYVDTPCADWLPVFWEGRNNFTDPNQVLSDIAAQVATVPSYQTYLILSILNANAVPEQAGGNLYKQIIGLNSQLSSAYGPHYLDIRSVLVNSYDATQATDVTDFKNDEVPTSLRAILAQSSLAADIGTSDTTIQLDSGDNLVAGEILTIDSGLTAENVVISSVNGSTVLVVRGFGGTQGPHDAGAPVVESDYLHLNAKGYQIVANSVAQFLAAYKGSADEDDQ